MVRTVVVRNLSTGAEVTYVNDLPVEQIVLNAYMQMERQNFSWWTYDEVEHPKVEALKHAFYCGDWYAFVDGHRFQAKEAAR